VRVKSRLLDVVHSQDGAFKLRISANVITDSGLTWSVNPEEGDQSFRWMVIADHPFPKRLIILPKQVITFPEW